MSQTKSKQIVSTRNRNGGLTRSAHCVVDGAGLKIQCPQGRGSSILPGATIFLISIQCLVMNLRIGCQVASRKSHVTFESFK